MPLTFTTVQGSSVQNTTTSVTTATGTAGDLIIAICMGGAASGGTVPPAPTGTIASGSWTVVDPGAIGASNRSSSKAYRATAPSTAAITVTKANQTGTLAGLNMLIVYRIPNAVMDTPPSSNEVDSGGTFTPSPGGNPGTAGGLAIDYAVQYTNGTTGTLTMPAGWTALAQLGTGSTRGIGRVAHKDVTTTGTVASGTVTSSINSTSSTWCGQLLTISPTASPVNTGQFLPFF